MKENLKIAFISFTISLIAFIGGTYYTKAKNAEAMDEVSYLLAGYVKVQLFDPDKITQQIRSEGATPADIASYFERYIKLHEKKGILLIESKHGLSKPNIALSAVITMDELDKLSEHHGIVSEINYESMMKEFNNAIQREN